MRWVFGADVKPFQRGLNTMRTQTQAFSRSVKGMLLSAFGMTAIIAGFKSLFAEMDRIHKLAVRFRETAETMQRLAHVADLNGANLEVVANAMARVTKNAYEATRGNKAMQEAFSAINIDAAAFLNMPLEQKLIILSGAYDRSTQAGESMAQMMDVLGRSGSELIPTLAEGQAKLEAQLKSAAVLSNSAVDSIKRFNDSLTSLGNKSKSIGGEVVEAFMFMGAAIELGLNKAFASSEDAAKQWRRRMNNLTHGIAVEGAGGSPESEAELEMLQKRFELEEEIAKIKEDSRQKELSIAQKILEMEEKRGDLLMKSFDASNENERLEIEKQILEIYNDISKLKDDQDEEQKKAADELVSAAQKIADATADMSRALADAATDEAKSDRDRKFRSLDDDGKIEMLTNEQEELMRQSDEAGKIGDFEGQIRRRIEAKEKGDEILSIAKDALSNIKGPTIATSSLASIGAGGSANLLTGDTNEKRKISLLEVIANNTSRGETGSSNIPEPI